MHYAQSDRKHFAPSIAVVFVAADKRLNYRRHHKLHWTNE